MSIFYHFYFTLNIFYCHTKQDKWIRHKLYTYEVFSISNKSNMFTDVVILLITIHVCSYLKTGSGFLMSYVVILLITVHVCSYLKPGSGFLTSYVVVFLCSMVWEGRWLFVLLILDLCNCL